MDKCKKCGCEIYIYKQVERTIYVGTFGEDPEASDTKIVRANKTVECANCGHREPKKDAMKG